MSVAGIVAPLAVLGAVGAVVWWYVVVRRAHREAKLTTWFPPLRSPGRRDVSMIPDPLLAAGSSFTDAEADSTGLRQLVDEYGRLTMEEEFLATSRETADAAEGRVEAAMRRVEAVRGAKFLAGVRTAFRERKLQRAQANLDVARTDAARAESKVSASVAHLQRLESTVATAGTRWEQTRRARAKDAEVERALVERNTLLVMFFDSVKPKAIARLLSRYRLTVVGGTARLSLFVVQPRLAGSSTGEFGEAARLHALAERLRKEKIVEAAVLNMRLEAATVSPLPAAPVVPSRALIVSRFPEAWEFNRSAQATRSIDVGVLDVGFLPNSSELTVTPLAGRRNQEDAHGTGVAAIIGAKHGNGIGIDGAAPFVRLFGAAPEGALFDEFTTLLEAMLRHTPPLRVINASVSYNWRAKGIVPRNSLETRRLVAEKGKIVRKAMLDAERTVLVAAAGNDCEGRVNCDEPATWASPYNWAALGEGDRSLNIIVVEGLDVTGTRRLPMSNTGGTIRAVGERVLTIGTLNVLSSGTGTSAAAPLVTAAIALMLQINPGLNVGAIRTNLGLGLGLGTGRAPKLDALAAVRRSAVRRT